MMPTFKAIGLVVADMPAAVAFYRLLGLAFDSDVEQHEECAIAPGVRLMLDSEAMIGSLNPGWTRPSGGGPQAALAFEMDSPKAVDQQFAKMTEHGYRAVHEPFDAFWGQRYSTILDPDGNWVDLYAALPAAGAA